jgi:hypothetical protein
MQSFRSRQPDGYVDVPYFNPELPPFDPELSADRLYWPEGEKDTDTVAGLDLLAFTFGGAEDIPEAAAQCVKGRHIVVVADIDAAGATSAQKKAAFAHQHGATSVRIVRPHHKFKDITEHVDARKAQDLPPNTIADELEELADAESLWQPDDGITQQSDGTLGEPPLAPLFTPTPFAWRDPAEIKRREWLYATHYIRKFVSCTIGRRGHGKTTRAIAEMLSMVTGRDLLKTGNMPKEKLRVWYIGENPRDEIERRIIAACVHYGIQPSEIEGRLFFDSILSLPSRSTRVGKLKGTEVVRNQQAIDALTSGIESRGIDVLIIDPLKKFHAVPENSNDHMDEIMEVFAEIAEETNSVIEILHHTRKPTSGNGSNPMTVDDGRGADAIIAVSCSARIINLMTQAEALKIGVEENESWRYSRIDNGKANMAPPGAANWTQLWSEILPCGESVGVTMPWDLPKPFDDVTTDHLRQCRKVAHFALIARRKNGSARRSQRSSASTCTRKDRRTKRRSQR